MQRAVGRRDVRIGRDHPLPDALRHRLSFLQQRRLVDGQNLAVAHDEFAVHHHRMHDAGMPVMGDIRQEPDDRTHRRRIQVEDRQVRLHAGPQRADPVGRPDAARRVHGDHVENILRRRADAILLLAAAAGAMSHQPERHGLEHVLAHVVGAEHDLDAGITNQADRRLVQAAPRRAGRGVRHAHLAFGQQRRRPTACRTSSAHR